MINFWQKLGGNLKIVWRKFWAFSPKNVNFSENVGSVSFWPSHFKWNFWKTLWAVFERKKKQITDLLTYWHTDRGSFIGPFPHGGEIQKACHWEFETSNKWYTVFFTSVHWSQHNWIIVNIITLHYYPHALLSKLIYIIIHMRKNTVFIQLHKDD